MKGLRNINNDFYYANQQCPEQYIAERKDMQDKIQQVRGKNKSLPPERQVKAVIKNKTLLINNVPQKTAIRPPTLAEIFVVDRREQEKIDEIPMAASELTSEKGSEFMGYAATVSSLTEIR